MSHFLYLNIGSKIDCVVYTGMYNFMQEIPVNNNRVFEKHATQIHIVYLRDNSLLISAPKSSVTLFTPDTHQAKTHPNILIEDSRLLLVKCSRILGVYLDPSLSFSSEKD